MNLNKFVKEMLVGKSLSGSEFSDNDDNDEWINKEIIGVFIGLSEGREDAGLCIDFKIDEDNSIDHFFYASDTLFINEILTGEKE